MHEGAGKQTPLVYALPEGDVPPLLRLEPGASTPQGHGFTRVWRRLYHRLSCGGQLRKTQRGTALCARCGSQ